MTTPPVTPTTPPEGALPTVGQAPESAAKPPRNKLAEPALVVAFLFWPGGLVLGIISLVQIKRRGERGAGLAIAAVSWTGLLALVTLSILCALFVGDIVRAMDPDRAATGSSSEIEQRKNDGDNSDQPNADEALPQNPMGDSSALMRNAACETAARANTTLTAALGESVKLAGTDFPTARAGMQKAIDDFSASTTVLADPQVKEAITAYQASLQAFVTLMGTINADPGTNRRAELEVAGRDIDTKWQGITTVCAAPAE